MLELLRRTRRYLKARPPVANIYQLWRNLALRLASPEQRFAGFYVNNAWQGQESRSGWGSDLEQTAALRSALPDLLRRP